MTFDPNASKKELVKLVRREQQGRTAPSPSASANTTAPTVDEQTPLLPTQVPLHSEQAENERLMRASNLK